MSSHETNTGIGEQIVGVGTIAVGGVLESFTDNSLFMVGGLVGGIALIGHGLWRYVKQNGPSVQQSEQVQ